MQSQFPLRGYRTDPQSSRYRFPCAIYTHTYTQKPRSDREVHGSRTGTDEYFIVRSRNGVITFLWFLFLHVHVSAVIVHAPPSSLFVDFVRNEDTHVCVYILLRVSTLDLIVAFTRAQYSKGKDAIRGEWLAPTFVISYPWDLVFDSFRWEAFERGRNARAQSLGRNSLIVTRQFADVEGGY